MITAETGRKIAPVELENTLYSCDTISFFSLEQKENSDIILSVVPRKRRRDIDADEIKGKVSEVVGDTIRIDVHKVGEVPSEINGKFRFVKRTQ